MGQIQSNIGLITGFPIVDTVDQLMEISARPRDLLVSRNAQLQNEQIAVTQLTSLLVSLQGAAGTLNDADIFDVKSVSSSDSSLLAASLTNGGNPATGSYQFTPVRQARSQQLISSALPELDEPVGTGTLTFQFGGFVDGDTALDQLNGGEGVRRGEIRITDRTGSSATIDLRFAMTVDDVLNAINSSTAINVTADANGDSFRLTDHSSSAAGILSVQEVGTGKTAEDLGLESIQTSNNVATGDDVLQLYDSLKLSRLNGDNGVQISDVLADLRVTFRDGSSDLDIDFDGSETTLGELVAAINTTAPARLSAQISVDRDHIQLTDLTTGTETFSVTSLFGGTTAEDLGLINSANAGVITSDRLQRGLKTALLRNLKGGSGIGDLGYLFLQNRSGENNAYTYLSNSETVQDLIEEINNNPIRIVARVNDARNGIILEDTSGGTGHLIVGNADATNSADALGIAVDAAVDSINSGTLDLQVVSENTLLASLNGGGGIELESFIITDTNGNAGAVKLNGSGSEITTLGGVIEAVNSIGIAVQARINDTGDGLLLIDTAGGPETLSVNEVGSATTAADLKILGNAVEVDIGGNLTHVIDGSARHTVFIDSDDTVGDLITRINDLEAGVTANSVFDGQSNRLSLFGSVTGSRNGLLIDTSDTGFTLQEIAKAQDAILLFGSPEVAAVSVLVSSANNTFSQVVSGLDLIINESATDAVTINVANTHSTLTTAITDLVAAYNAIIDNIDQATFFNEADNTTGILFGSSEVLRVETELARLITRAFFGVGNIRSLETVGIEIADNGKLSLNSDQLNDIFQSDVDGLKQFFTDDTGGFFAKIDALVESLAGADNSLLTNRSDALSDTVEQNNNRIAFLNERLNAERELLLNQFFQMELAVASLQDSLAALNLLTVLPPLSI